MSCQREKGEGWGGVRGGGDVGGGGGGSTGHPERQLRNFQMFRDTADPQDMSGGHPSTTHKRPKGHT